MWPGLQALDLGAILMIAAVKKVGGPGPVPSHQLKRLRRRRKTTRQECLKRSVFSRVCSPFYTLQFGVRFRTHARDREKRKERRVTSTQNRCHNFARPMSVAKAVRLGRRRSSRCSPAGATAAATARAHIRSKDAFTSTHDFTAVIWTDFVQTVLMIKGALLLSAIGKRPNKKYT
jgi:hypothetical protein